MGKDAGERIMEDYTLIEGKTRNVRKTSSSTLKPIAPPTCGEPIMDTCGNCGDCHFWRKTDGNFGSCNNTDHFYYGYGCLDDSPNKDKVSKSGAIIEEDEGWGWVTSSGFGCVNFKKMNSIEKPISFIRGPR